MGGPGGGMGGGVGAGDSDSGDFGLSLGGGGFFGGGEGDEGDDQGTDDFGLSLSGRGGDDDFGLGLGGRGGVTDAQVAGDLLSKNYEGQKESKKRSAIQETINTFTGLPLGTIVGSFVDAINARDRTINQLTDPEGSFGWSRDRAMSALGGTGEEQEGKGEAIDFTGFTGELFGEEQRQEQIGPIEEEPTLGAGFLGEEILSQADVETNRKLQEQIRRRSELEEAFGTGAFFEEEVPDFLRLSRPGLTRLGL